MSERPTMTPIDPDERPTDVLARFVSEVNAVAAWIDARTATPAATPRDGDTRQGACPMCGAPAELTYRSDLGRESVCCLTCAARRMREERERKAAILARFPQFSPRVVNALARYFQDGLEAVLAASDDELLGVRSFGHAMLAEFRAAWPEATDG